MLEARRQVGPLGHQPGHAAQLIECEDIDSGARPGVTTAESAELRASAPRSSWRATPMAG
jgi:hypothetical protein